MSSEDIALKRNGRPPSHLVDRTYKADEETYQKLVEAATAAIIKREKNVYALFPYFVKFADSFPKGVRKRYDATRDIYKIKTDKLMDWLYNEGHSNHNYFDVMEISHSLARMEGEIDRRIAQSCADAEKQIEKENENAG